MKRINLPAEDRIYFMSDLDCIKTAYGLKCEPKDVVDFDGFVFVGKKLWADQEETLIECQKIVEERLK